VAVAQAAAPPCGCPVPAEALQPINLLGTCCASVTSADLHSRDERPLTAAAPENPLASTIALVQRVLAHRAEQICCALSVGKSNDEATRMLV